LARTLIVVRFFTVLVMPGLMIGMTMALRAGLGRNGARRSSPDHAACNEGERNEQDYKPSPQELHQKKATIALRTGQLRHRHRRVVRRRKAMLVTSTELRLMAALAIMGFSNRPKAG